MTMSTSWRLCRLFLDVMGIAAPAAAWEGVGAKVRRLISSSTQPETEWLETERRLIFKALARPWAVVWPARALFYSHVERFTRRKKCRIRSGVALHKHIMVAVIVVGVPRHDRNHRLFSQLLYWPSAGAAVSPANRCSCPSARSDPVLRSRG